MENIKKAIRTIPDFPKQGIMFRDITTLLKDADAFKEAIDALVERYQHQTFDLVAGIESRGFIIAGIIAHLLGKDLSLSANRGNSPQKPFVWTTSWNTARMRWKCTKTVFSKEPVYWLLMTSWPPEAP